MPLPAIAELDTLGPDAFAAALQPLFEAAPVLASALYAARPFASYPRLIDTAESLARAMSFDDRAAVLSAHPRIGADPASVSAASFREQGYAAEAGMQPAELRAVYGRLDELNRAYEQRFGFRFVVFVNGRTKPEIVEVLARRLHNSREAELDTGLRDMFLIARARLLQSEPAGARRRSMGDMHDDDPARRAVLDELARCALETYGEDRAGEATLQAALKAAATAVWRVTREPLEPGSTEP